MRWAGVLGSVLVILAGACATEAPPAMAAGVPQVPVPPSQPPNPALAQASLPTPPIDPSACPWLAAAMAQGTSPAELAKMTLSRMTLQEKLGELVLVSSGPYENVNAGVARLCIPSLTLMDGPWGIAYGDTGVSLLPAPLGVASSFDPSLARRYGQIIGAQARAQGLDVSQGPNLNLDRVPEWGRAAETWGEDPLLVSAMGAADIQGRQSQGVMADVKHLVGYQQETNRGSLDVHIGPRALNELYAKPLQIAASQAGTASVMCAYPRLNGTYQCEDGTLIAALQAWNPGTFVRSDLGAVHDQPAAVLAGTALIKPSSIQSLADEVTSGAIPAGVVDANLLTVLTQMFTFGVVGRTSPGAPGSPVETPADRSFALTAAERAAVLLRNQGGTLPLQPSRTRSVAVIGAAASNFPMAQGYGSSRVVPPFLSTPLTALRTALGSSTSVTYQPGGSTTDNLPVIPQQYLTPDHGGGHGLTLTVDSASNGAAPTTSTTSTQPNQATATSRSPVPAASLQRDQSPGAGTEPGGEQGTPPAERPEIETGQSPRDRLLTIDPTATDAPTVTLPYGSTGSRLRWSGTFTPPRSGRFTFSLAGTGSMAMTLDGRTVVADTLPHGTGSWAGTTVLDHHHHYRLSLTWTPIPDATNLGVPSLIDLGMAFVGDAVAKAVAAARTAQVAVVYAADYSAETFDRPSLSLPGDQDVLINAVAAANPRTVVVLNTSGPVLMPWKDKVASILETWYPGEQEGTAAAALLTGAVSPSGHLPVTFPASQKRSAISTTSQWPGQGLTSTYSEGLAVGYRWNNLTGTAPLYPFGFGLSYTTFRLSRPALVASGETRAVKVTVQNTGRRAGSDVIQAYLTYPATAQEPPRQLVAFQVVAVPAGATRTVTLTVPPSALPVFLGGAWVTVPGPYAVAVGDSSTSLTGQVGFTVASGTPLPAPAPAAIQPTATTLPPAP